MQTQGNDPRCYPDIRGKDKRGIGISRLIRKRNSKFFPKKRAERQECDLHRISDYPGIRIIHIRISRDPPVFATDNAAK